MTRRNEVCPCGSGKRYKQCHEALGTMSIADADNLLRSGRDDEAEACYQQLLDARPGDFALLLRLAQLMEKRGRIAEAIAKYEAVISAVPGHAFPFTRRAILLFRNRFGAPVPSIARVPGANRITMSTLGSNGRFGNQLLQYGFLRMYAAEHGLTVETPDWIGRDLFDLNDPMLDEALPAVSEADVDFVASLNRQVPLVWRNADLWGYCCYPTAGLRRYENLFRGLFHPGERVSQSVAAAEKELRGMGNTVVAIHLRRGDFGYGRFWLAPSAWYSDWLDDLWPALNRPVLYVASDDASAAAELARFRPVTAADLGIEMQGVEFYPDFHLLTQADALAISNSTFSFTAAMLNVRARTFVRPDRDKGRLVSFAPWDAPVLM